MIPGMMSRRKPIIMAKPKSMETPIVGKRRSQSRWTPEIVARLGIEPDAIIGAELGLSAGTVSAYRARHQIKAKASIRKKIRWDLVIKNLGKVSDSVLAKKLGVSKQTIANKRASLGIPSCRSNQSV